MGTITRNNTDNNMKLVSTIAEKILQEDKDEIKNSLDLLNSIRDKESYNSKIMHKLFFYWKKYIPQPKT